jgi:hypothetical protein
VLAHQHLTWIRDAKEKTALGLMIMMLIILTLIKLKIPNNIEIIDYRLSENDYVENKSFDVLNSSNQISNKYLLILTLTMTLHYL